MAQFTTVIFKVDDVDGGATTRTFTFETIPQGDQYQVTIYFEVSAQVVIKLSKDKPSATIPECGGRVEPKGTLSLSWDGRDPTVLVLFTGTLCTSHSTSMQGVCVGAIDL